jgi:hypothetical protein
MIGETRKSTTLMDTTTLMTDMFIKKEDNAAHGRVLKVGEVVRVICNRSAGTIEWWVKDEKLGGTFNCEKLKNKENDVRFSITMCHVGDEVQIQDMN